MWDILTVATAIITATVLCYLCAGESKKSGYNEDTLPDGYAIPYTKVYPEYYRLPTEISLDDFKRMLAYWEHADTQSIFAVYDFPIQIQLSIKINLFCQVYRDPTVQEKHKRLMLRHVSLFHNNITEDPTQYNPILQLTIIEAPDEIRTDLVNLIAKIAYYWFDHDTKTQRWDELTKFIRNSSLSDDPSLQIAVLNIIHCTPNHVLKGMVEIVLIDLLKKCLLHTNVLIRSTAIKAYCAVMNAWKEEKTIFDRLATLFPIIIKLAKAEKPDEEGTARLCLYGMTSSLIASKEEDVNPFIILGKQAIMDTRMDNRSFYLFYLSVILDCSFEYVVKGGDEHKDLCKTLLEAVQSEETEEIICTLAKMIALIAGKTFDADTRVQKWTEFLQFMKKYSNSIHCKKIAVSIMQKNPDVFGDIEERILETMLKKCLEDGEECVRSAATTAFSTMVLSMEESKLRDVHAREKTIRSITLLVLQMSLKDQSIKVGSPRHCVGILVDNSDFARNLSGLATQKGEDAFIHYLSFLIPPIIDGCKETIYSIDEEGHGSSSACLPEMRNGICSLLLFFARSFKNSFVPYVDKSFKVVLLYLSNRNCQPYREWAVELFPFLLGSLKSKGDIGRMRTILSAYTYALIRAVEFEANIKDANYKYYQYITKYIHSIALSIAHFDEKELHSDQITEIRKLLKFQSNKLKWRKADRKRPIKMFLHDLINYDVDNSEKAVKEAIRAVEIALKN